MAKTKIIKLENNHFEDWTHVNGGLNVLCKRELNKYFVIPDDVKTIFVKLSNRKSKDAYLVESLTNSNKRSFCSGDPRACIRLDKKADGKQRRIIKERLYYVAEDILKRFGVPCYVSIEY